MEHRGVGLVHIHAVNAAGGDDADRGALFGHRADLHRRGVGAQNMGRAIVALGAVHEEGVMFLPRGVFGRNVQGVEIIPVALDLRAGRDGKAHVGEDRGKFIHHLTDGVNGAGGARAAGKGDVKPFALEPGIKRGIGETGFAGAQGGVNLILQQVERGTRGLAFLGGHAAQFAHFQADLALFAKGGKTDLFQRGFVRGIGDGGDVLAAQGGEIGHSGLRGLGLC